MWSSFTRRLSPRSSHAAFSAVSPDLSLYATLFLWLRILRRNSRVVLARVLSRVMEIFCLGAHRLALKVLPRPGPSGLVRLDHLAGGDLGMVLVRQVGEVAPHLVRGLGREFADLL